MLDPISLMGAIAVASSLAAGGSLFQAGKATMELVQRERPPIGQALDRAFRAPTDSPDDMMDLLARLD